MIAYHFALNEQMRTDGIFEMAHTKKVLKYALKLAKR